MEHKTSQENLNSHAANVTLLTEKTLISLKEIEEVNSAMPENKQLAKPMSHPCYQPEHEATLTLSIQYFLSGLIELDPFGILSYKAIIKLQIIPSLMFFSICFN